MFAGSIGLITGLAILVPCGTSMAITNFTIASLVDQVIGFSLGDLLAAIVKQPRQPVRPASEGRREARNGRSKVPASRAEAWKVACSAPLAGDLRHPIQTDG